MGSELISTSQPEDLESINAIVHDRWFSVSKVEFDKSTASLSIKFSMPIGNNFRVDKRFFFLEKVRIPIVECAIDFYNISNYKILDTEKIDIYDFNIISYSASDGLINISTGVPLLFHIYTTNFSLSIKKTDKVVAEVSSWRLNWGKKHTRR